MSKILMVDDDDAMRGLLRQQLEGTHDVADTGKPADALAMALDFKPDCILLDLMMPALSGLELCQTLQSLSYTRAIPIFMITGESAEKYRDFCKGLGAKEFFEKPVNIAQLKERLAETLKVKQLQRRRAARVQLRVELKLRGVDVDGAGFEVITTTENVSASGFYCVLGARLREGDSVEVLVVTGGERLVGRARVVRAACRTNPVEHYGFEFTEKPGNWLLG
jgi:CheY-like chemotaxis protein